MSSSSSIKSIEGIEGDLKVWWNNINKKQKQNSWSG